MKHRAALAILCLCVLAAAGCAGTPLRPDTSALEQEIQRLRAQVVELQRQAAMNEVEMARLRQQLGEAGGRPAPPRATSTQVSPQASRGTTPQTTAAPPRQTTRPMEEPPRTTPSTSAPRTTVTQPAAPRTTAPRTTTPAEPRTTAPRTTTPEPARPAPSEPAPVRAEEIEEDDIEVPEAPPVRPQTRPSTPPPAPPPAADSGEVLAPASQALYDRGYTLYHQGHFVDAETSFQRFLQGNPRSELADNAQYWIGECRYARGDIRGALAAFRETVSRFPEGNKVPDAMLKAGQCLEALDDVEGARDTYEEVVRRFPGTAAASAADERRLSLR